MQGSLDSIISLIGWSSIAFVLLSGFIDVSQSRGGTFNLVNETMASPEKRDNILDLQLSSLFLTPLVNIGGRMFSVDAVTILIVLFMSLSVLYLVMWLFHPGHFYSIPLFIITFLVIATLWQGFWMTKYLNAGQSLGISHGILMDNLAKSSIFFENPLLFAINIIAFVFIISKAYTILPFV